MNILFLDAYYEPETIAYTHLEKDLIEGFIDAGHKVSIICPVPTRGISEEIREQYKGIKKECKYNGKLRISRFWAPQEGKNIAVRAFRYLWCNIRTYQKALRYQKVDLVFSNSTPPTQGALGGKVAQKLSKKYRKKVPFVYNLQDIFPDSLVNTNLTYEGSFLWKIGRKLENYTYNHADKIIVISDDFKRNIFAKGVLEEKIVTVPNWVNTEEVYPIDRNDNILFQRYKLDPSLFYVCYSGNIGHTQNLDLLIEVAERLKTQNKEIRFVIIGEGVAKTEFEQKIKQHGLDNIIVIPFQPYEEIAHVFSLGNVGLIISKAGIGSNSVPSKTWSIMAAERAIVASFDETSQLSNAIRRIGCGVVANADDIEELLSKIQYLYTHREESVLMGKTGRDYVLNVLNKEKCINAYKKTMVNVVREENETIALDR